LQHWSKKKARSTSCIHDARKHNTHSFTDARKSILLVSRKYYGRAPGAGWEGGMGMVLGLLRDMQNEEWSNHLLIR
jgi:hypothetical protein